jgi:hypothetical protein
VGEYKILYQKFALVMQKEHPALYYIWDFSQKMGQEMAGGYDPVLGKFGAILRIGNGIEVVAPASSTEGGHWSGQPQRIINFHTHIYHPGILYQPLYQPPSSEDVMHLISVIFGGGGAGVYGRGFETDELILAHEGIYEISIDSTRALHWQNKFLTMSNQNIQKWKIKYMKKIRNVVDEFMRDVEKFPNEGEKYLTRYIKSMADHGARVNFRPW